MKKLLTILFAVLMIACKKSETKPIDNVVHEKHGLVSVTINSNYNYPFLNIYRNNLFMKQGGGGNNVITELCTWNNGPSNYKHPVKMSYTINSKDTGSYFIYSFANKNANDSTLYMVDNNKLWLSVKVVDQFGLVIMDSTSISYAHITCKFKVK